MKTRKWGFTLLGLLLMLSMSSVSAEVIYDETAGSAAGTNDLEMSSSFSVGMGTPPFTAADDFVLANSATATSMTFWASSAEVIIGEQGLSLVSIDPGSFNLTYTFYDALGPDGGTALASGTVLASNVTSTAAGYNNWIDIPVYELTFDLSSPLLLDAGSTYWIEVQADTSSSEQISFAWSDFSGTGGNSMSLQSSDGVYATIRADRAFLLEGERQVPLPGTLLLIGLGLLGLARRAIR